MKKIEELTIKEAKEELELVRERYLELSKELGKELGKELREELNRKETNHGWCIVVLDKGFMYIGELITDGEYLTINQPKNIRSFTSGKGLLWHAKNGSEDMILDAFDGILKAPYTELKHFILTDKDLWK